MSQATTQAGRSTTRAQVSKWVSDPGWKRKATLSPGVSRSLAQSAVELWKLDSDLTAIDHIKTIKPGFLCAAQPCPYPMAPPNGHISPVQAKYILKDSFSIFCETGYELLQQLFVKWLERQKDEFAILLHVPCLISH
ncbi:hypothetical protein P7K49_015429 [Saguinus oedipus]|uniref:Uncharacterized protein n=1 Tax=Saguinus oedipus TaxID=9490 RepID=A0ABQ9VA18_SAGOE|nr:hypothetical protein P7K49_015429 [Saguinus oedipus]